MAYRLNPKIALGKSVEKVTRRGRRFPEGGALGDRALPEAHGKIGVLWVVQNAEFVSNVMQRIFSLI